VFDVSHMGEIWVKGEKALPFLQHVTVNDVSALVDGKAQYSALPNGRGGLVDDILVYRIDALTYLLVVNASNIEKDWAHLSAHAAEFGITPGRELYNASDEICQLAVQGPLAMKVVQKMCPAPVEDIPYYTFVKTSVAGISGAILSATGYTGSGGCEIYVANGDADKLWTALWEAGAEYGLKNIGLGARDTLRLEKGFCLYGNDLDDTTSTIEAGLGWITKFTEGKDFIDRPLFERQKKEGVTRKLVGFKMTERGIPRHGYELATPDGKVMGVVTSGTMSPMLKEGIGLGYVKPEYAAVGSEIAVVIRDKPVKAVVIKLPFV
jgi:aminomethyltransferase